MTGRIIHSLWLLLVGLLLVFAILISVARLWVPVLGDYREAAEQLLGEHLERPVTIARMEATWRGLNPVLKLRGLSIGAPRGNGPPLEIAELWVGIDLQDYLQERELRPASIDIIGAVVSLVRDRDGRVGIEGFGHDAGGSEGLSWLLSMERLAIHDSRVRYTDLKPGRAPLRFSDVTLTLHNTDDRYSIIGYAMLPSELGYRVDVQGVLEAGGDRPADWDGRLYLKGQSVALAPENLPPMPGVTNLAGVADVRGWLEIRRGRVASATSELDITDLRVSGPDSGDILGFDRLTGQLGWRAREHGWQVAGQNLAVEQSGTVRSGTEFAVTRDGAGGAPRVAVQINRLDLRDLRLLAILAPGVDSGQRRQLLALQPVGMIEDMTLQIAGPDGAREVTGFDAVFRDVGFGTPGNTPLVRHLHGSITGGSRAGALWLDSTGVRVRDEGLFRDELVFDAIGGEAVWERREGLLSIRSDDLRLANEDLELQAALTVVFPGGGVAPIVDLDADFVRGSVRRVRHYLPARVMPPSGVEWLDRSLVSGEIEQGRIVVQGRLDQLPFDHGEGVLRVSLPVRNAILDYSPDWTQITRLDAEVNFTGRGMDIHSRSGYLRSAKLARVHARIPDLAHPDLTIRGRVNGRLDVMLAELDSSPLGEVYGAFTERVSGTGPAGLDLDILIPLHDESRRELAVSGVIHLSGNTLRVREEDIRLEAIRGRLTFTPDDFSGSALQARLLDTPVTVDVWSDESAGRTVIRSRGALDLVGQVTRQQSALAHVLNGRSDWEVRLSLGRLEHRYQVPDAELALSSLLEGVAVDLPAPFGKPAAEPRPLEIKIAGLANPDRDLHVRYGDVLRGRMILEAGEQGPAPARSRLVLGPGQAELPDDDVLEITGRLARFSLDEWLPVLADLQGDGGLPVRLDLAIDALEVAGYALHEVGLQAGTAGLVQDITLTGKSAQGHIALSRTSQGIEKVVANLDRLRLQSLPEAAPVPAVMKPGPADMPELNLSIGKLRVDDIKFGNALLETARSTNTVEVKQLVVSSKMIELRATGNWRGKRGLDRCWFDIEISNGRLDRLLEAFDYAEEVEGGELSGSIHAGWQGAPWDFEPGRAEGRLYLDIRDGQLQSVKPGAGRVFGLVGLHTLPRRLSLDFSDLFRKGFSFDRIEGNFVLDGGNAYTDDLQIEGPAARIDITGRIGLAEQDYDQLVTVMPNLSSSLPLAGVLAGGPAVGAALLIADQLLDSEIDGMAVQRYAVTGPWSEPVYEKLGEKKKKPLTSDPLEDIE